MPRISIPRTSPRGQPRNYAWLILEFSSFSGKIFKCGSTVDEAELWPTSHYPIVPLLLEYAGNDRSGRGHNRSRDIHVLWRYSRERKEWDEIARTLSEGPEWLRDFAPIVERELVRPEIDHTGEARGATARLRALIDGELAALAREGKAWMLSFLFDEVASRLAQQMSEQAAVYGGTEALRSEVLEEEAASEIERFPPGRALTSVPGLAAGEDEASGSGGSPRQVKGFT